MEFTLRLEKKFLHKDLETIREGRRALVDAHGNAKTAIICLAWNGGAAEHKINVHVKGPNLWVTGYECDGRAYVNFEAEQGSLNYCKSDEGCNLELTAIKAELEKLETIDTSEAFYRGAAGRTPYVMCVFTASEMVRNEILERLLFCEKEKNSRTHYTWKECVPLYKNWESVSKVLYAIESGTFYPVIYFHDMDGMFVRIMKNGALYNSVGKIYEGILKDIKAL